MRKLQALWLLLVVGLVPATLVAAPYDGSKPLLCAVLTALECDTSGECQAGTAESVNIPQFITVDAGQKMMSAANDKNRKTEIKSTEHLDDHMILQGVQGNRGWSMVIAKETGKMSSTVVENGAGFMIFGACTLR